MNDNNTLHFDFLLEHERLSSRPFRMRFIIPVLSLLCLLVSGVVWMEEILKENGITSNKQLLGVKISNLKTKHAYVLKERAEEKELAAQLQQLEFYRTSKNAVGATLANLTNCVSSRIQLTELRLRTQTAAPLNGFQVRPQNALELAKLCPTNQIEGVTLRLVGRSVQSGGNPGEVNSFLHALQDPAFTSLISQTIKPKVSFQEELSSTSVQLGEGHQQEIVLFEIVYECLPRRFL
jgi:hypothetical protein